MSRIILHRSLAIKFFFSFLLILHTSLNAQGKYEALEKLELDNLTCYFSKGSEEKAKKISALCSRAISYFEKLLNFKPDVDVLVLTATDWKDHTNFPVYGMPHYTGKETLIVASDDNPFWKSFIPAEENISPALMSKVRDVYKNDKGMLSMEAFFELLVIHELGHAFLQQAGISMQRKWLAEFYPNLMLHSFVAETDPGKLPALTLFPEIVLGGGKNEYAFTTLQQLESNYQLIATQHPNNYGWYQSRWHKGAADVYDAGGEILLLKFWNAFRLTKTEIKDEDLADFLEVHIHPAMGNFFRNWDDE